MHGTVDLKVLYFGTPVVLVSSRNPDGTTNVAPMSSAWWLGLDAMIGMSSASRTTANLQRDPRCVLNLVPSTLAPAVNRLAMTTGVPEVPEYKAAMGYGYVADKFAWGDLTRQPSTADGPDRVLECPIQLEGVVVDEHAFNGSDVSASAFQIAIHRAHVDDGVLLPGTDYIDPLAWDPLIMKFCDLFGGGAPVGPSRLADGWNMPGRVGRAASPRTS